MLRGLIKPTVRYSNGRNDKEGKLRMVTMDNKQGKNTLVRQLVVILIVEDDYND